MTNAFVKNTTTGEVYAFRFEPRGRITGVCGPLERDVYVLSAGEPDVYDIGRLHGLDYSEGVESFRSSSQAAWQYLADDQPVRPRPVVKPVAPGSSKDWSMEVQRRLREIVVGAFAAEVSATNWRRAVRGEVERKMVTQGRGPDLAAEEPEYKAALVRWQQIHELHMQAQRALDDW